MCAICLLTKYVWNFFIAEDIHNIDIFSGEESSETDMRKVYNAIKTFVSPSSDEYPPLFCVEEDIEKNKGCLDWLAERSSMLFIENIISWFLFILKSVQLVGDLLFYFKNL